MSAEGRGPRAVELHIGELLLHGVAFADRHAVADGVRRQMARLLAESGIPVGLTRGVEIEGLDGGEWELAEGASAQDVGAGIAQAVFGSLRRWS